VHTFTIPPALRVFHRREKIAYTAAYLTVFVIVGVAKYVFDYEMADENIWVALKAGLIGALYLSTLLFWVHNLAGPWPPWMEAEWQKERGDTWRSGSWG
jgi:hypothetical protein